MDDSGDYTENPRQGRLGRTPAHPRGGDPFGLARSVYLATGVPVEPWWVTEPGEKGAHLLLALGYSPPWWAFAGRG